MLGELPPDRTIFPPKLVFPPYKDKLPEERETVWVTDGLGYTTLGCIVYLDDAWHWAESNGIIYQEKGNIVSECELYDIDVRFWHRLPKPPYIEI